jgi:hypothetical protein
VRDKTIGVIFIDDVDEIREEKEKYSSIQSKYDC